MDLRTVRWLSLLPFFCAAPSRADDTEIETDRAPGILSCASETDDARRLDCYDREIAYLLRDGMTIPVIAPRVARAQLEDEFGMRGVVLHNAIKNRQKTNPRIEKLEATVAKVAPNTNGRMQFELQNGQVWEQTQGSSVFFVKPGDAVSFTRGTLGSFWLTTEQRRTVRVRRLR
jgi:hypothetical protein